MTGEKKGTARHRLLRTGRGFWREFAQWVEFQRQFRGDTAQQYLRSGRHFCKLVDPPVPKQCTEKHILLFAAARSDAGLKIATIRKDLRHLNAFFNDQDGLKNPIGRRTRKTWRPFEVCPADSFHNYGRPEYQAMMEATAGMDSPVVWRLLIHLLYTCGMRLTECLHLLWADVDLDHEVLILRPHHGIPGVIEWEPKRLKSSGASQETLLPLDPLAVDLLNQRLEQQSDGVPYIFLSGKRYRLVAGRPKWFARRPRYIFKEAWRGFAKLKRLAGVGHGTFHDFRRTYVVDHLSEGAHLGEVMAITRQTPQTVMKYYARVENLRALDKARTINAKRTAVPEKQFIRP